MRAAITSTIAGRFTPTDITIDAPRGAEVLVTVKASGLCQTDFSITHTDFGFPMPLLAGHEIAGVVEAVGPDVRDITVGDHVVACVVQGCGHCQTCREGRPIDCARGAELDRAPGDPARLNTAEGPLFQIAGLGGFAEKILTHENQLVVVDKRIPFPQASIIGCATVTGAGAVIHSAGVRPGDSVAVIGIGGVGLNAIGAAKFSGAVTIIAVDLVDSKLELARKFGATHTINAGQQDPVEAIQKITGQGVDYGFEIIGNPATQQQTIEVVRPGGTAVLVGMGKPGSSVTLDTSVAGIIAHKTVKIVTMGNTNPSHDIPMYVSLYLEGRLNLDDLISQEISLDDIDQAYEELARGDVIRSIITRF